MDDRRKLYEGKAKIIFEGPTDDTVIQYFKDDATADNAMKKGSFKDKGLLNNLISSHLMTLLNEQGFHTHFLEKLNDREQLVKKVDIIPVEFVARNFATGSLVRRLGIEEGKKLVHAGTPLIEFYYKDDDLGDPLMAIEHIEMMKILERYQVNNIKAWMYHINKVLRQIFADAGINLIDYKLEFGWVSGTSNIILADEISPDTCRLWDMESDKKLDKDRFRLDLGGETEGYTEVAKRLGLI